MGRTLDLARLGLGVASIGFLTLARPAGAVFQSNPTQVTLTDVLACLTLFQNPGQTLDGEQLAEAVGQVLGLPVAASLWDPLPSVAGCDYIDGQSQNVALADVIALLVAFQNPSRTLTPVELIGGINSVLGTTLPEAAVQRVPLVTPTTTVVSALNTTVVKFSPADDEATLIARGAAVVRSGASAIYIGTQQVSSNNQDPIIARFTQGQRDWTITTYERSGADGRGRGLVWDQSENLYAVFTIDGTQGIPSEDFRRFTANGWLPSYGAGGGPAVTVVLKIDPQTGEGLSGTYVKAQLSNGNSNTLVPTGLDWIPSGLVLWADSYFSPLRPDRTPMTQTTPGGSPFAYRILLNPALNQVLTAEAIGWDGVSQFSPLP